ncbi:MAG: tryptophan-rich sensory protein [Nitriliruptoraceae bacterium]|nr:tryptophan-rich sensory protein [Nitriliruptoraceae bacterium]
MSTHPSDTDRAGTTGSASPARRWGALLVALLLAFAAGAVGNLLQGDGVAERYLALDRPVWAPPSEAFGIVWPVLYLLIAIAGWRLWERRSRPIARVTGGLWLAQLIVNAVWPGVFFGLEAFGPAIAVIVTLVALVASTVATAWRADRLAAALLVPYLAWIAYAMALNIAIWQLN